MMRIVAWPSITARKSFAWLKPEQGAPMKHLLSLVSSLVVMLSTPLVGQQIPLNRPSTSGDTVSPSATTETNRPPAIPFLEGTDVFWTVVKKDSIDEGAVFFPNRLEANIFPHLFLYQNFTDILDIDEQAERAAGKGGSTGKGVKEWAMVFSGTPAVRIRMLPVRSAPVRTPSYMPRGNFQFLRVRGLKDGIPPAERDQPRDRATFLEDLRRVPRVSLWELHVIAGHHSNGQEGCLSNEQHVEPPPPATDGECVPAGLVPTAETINRIDGSFSSAFFFRFGGNYSKNWLRDEETVSGTPLRQAYQEVRLSAEYEWHPSRWVDEQMRDIYGRHRANLGAAYAKKDVAWCQRRFEVATALTWNPGVVDPELDWSGSIQASCFPWVNGGWGFFARWYAGQDYYNVGFLDDINRLQAGLTFNQGEFFRFRKRPEPRKPTP
jgi:hypothetical protein